MVNVINQHSEQQDRMKTSMQSSAKKVLKKYKLSMIQKQKKQFSLLRSALPCTELSSDLQTVLQAIRHIRHLQGSLQG